MKNLNLFDPIKKVLLIVSVCLFLPACSTEMAMRLLAADEEARIGDRSVAKSQSVEDLLISAYALNTKPYLSANSFVVCLKFENVHLARLDNLSIKLHQVSLSLANGKVVKPTGYFDSGSCPNPTWTYNETIPKLVFTDIGDGAATAVRRPSQKTLSVNDIAFRFEISTINPSETFTLIIDEISINGVSHKLDKMEFHKVYGHGY